MGYVVAQGEGERDAWAQATAGAQRSGGQRLREVAEVIAPVEVAEAFNLPVGATAVVRRRVMLLDGRPVELTDSYYPLALARGTRLAQARKISGGAPTLLRELGHEVRQVAEDVSARLTTDDEQELLGLARPMPVILLRRTSKTAVGVPVEVSVMTMLAEGRHLHYEFTVGGDDDAQTGR
ncbi:UbiC family transcriptional regulator [Actinosynnema pretiosum]|uniref:UbiC family transcriptional regulator n=2 Tax=Actinosynnema pretiosum TaxID=42197 RepID=A0A290ZGI1_9PSEU|nr:UbiC family transcriptional regulator [Actinosynnema pretiosum]